MSNCSYSDNHEVGVFRQRHVRDVSLGFKDPAGKPARNCPIAVVAVDTSTAEQGRGAEIWDREILVLPCGCCRVGNQWDQDLCFDIGPFFANGSGPLWLRGNIVESTLPNHFNRATGFDGVANP
ncbi:type I phosphodiesterase / nucleotide pyrophosphatase family protein [Aspergillus luchuensis]|uniref:Type I phosphodiesterase / nucleotide pyrophosphatase family protein n=1 Tax=Aspergillus kawachii TaxID=1069201 RepID=A0A146FL68_ASPKA|nr:type I phosphodiesterase / nucleotide pyrophosphatase family protein [Aspergillus luchuensis]